MRYKKCARENERDNNNREKKHAGEKKDGRKNGRAKTVLKKCDVEKTVGGKQLEMEMGKRINWREKKLAGEKTDGITN